MAVGRRRVEYEVGEENDEDEVDGQGEVVDVAAERLPLVPDHGHAQRVAKQILDWNAIRCQINGTLTTVALQL